MNLYDKTSFQISEQVTKSYSTSFYTASKLFREDIRKAIFSIYGFVRLADEVVDTFHDYNKAELLERFELDYYLALKDGISLNPVLNSFQHSVKKYGISDSHVQAFLTSMKYDLEKKVYLSTTDTNQYIYGSADVVGLMCLRVFCQGDDKLYNSLETNAMKLGSAFQKVNFLRDLRNDLEMLERSYFPGVSIDNFDESAKKRIIAEIESDFDCALLGIRQLPKGAKLPVLVAYMYYKALLHKIKKTPAGLITSKRVRVSNPRKQLIFIKAIFVNKFDLV